MSTYLCTSAINNNRASVVTDQIKLEQTDSQDNTFVREKSVDLTDIKEEMIEDDDECGGMR